MAKAGIPPPPKAVTITGKAKTREATAARAPRIVHMAAITTEESRRSGPAAMAKKRALTRVAVTSILSAAHTENLRGKANLDPDGPMMILPVVGATVVLGVKRLVALTGSQIVTEKEPPTPAVSRVAKMNPVYQRMEEPRAPMGPLVAVETSTALPDMAGAKYSPREPDIQVEATNAPMDPAEEKVNMVLLDMDEADDQTNMAAEMRNNHTVPPDMAGRRDDPKNMVAEDMKAKETRTVLMDPAEDKAEIIHLDMAEADNQRDMAGDDLEMRNAHTDPLGVVETSMVLPNMAGHPDTPLAMSAATLMVLKDSTSVVESAMTTTTASDTMVNTVAVTASMILTISSPSGYCKRCSF